MKTYNDLTDEQKEKALNKVENDFLRDITEGSIQFDDEVNDEDLQKRIDSAIRKAENMQTPWFAHEYIWDDCKDDIKKLAIPIAETALYPEPQEIIIEGII